MKKILSALCAGALSVAMTGASLMPAQAAPAFVPNVPITTSGTGDVVQIQDYRWRRAGPGYGGRDLGSVYNDRRGGWRGDHRRGWGRDHRRGGWRGHHRGYRGNNLGGAVIGGLITGAIVGGVLNNNRQVYRGVDSHAQWCYDRYRTYRASDNTYVPRVGVRAYCNSPYN
jgi:hypothetical protein